LLYGLRCSDGVPVYGTRAELDSQPVGRLLSSAWSPFLNCGIGYVRMDAPGEWLGTRLQIPVMGGALAPAEVVSLPFYDPEKRIARGLDSDIP
jgi:aminomethyltransferase